MMLQEISDTLYLDAMGTRAKVIYLLPPYNYSMAKNLLRTRFLLFALTF